MVPPAAAPGVLLFTPLAPGFIICERDIADRRMCRRFIRTAVTMSDDGDIPAAGPAGTAAAGSDAATEPATARIASVRVRIDQLLVPIQTSRIELS
jgi:hypothetical protein